MGQNALKFSTSQPVKIDAACGGRNGPYVVARVDEVPQRTRRMYRPGSWRSASQRRWPLLCASQRLRPTSSARSARAR